MSLELKYKELSTSFIITGIVFAVLMLLIAVFVQDKYKECQESGRFMIQMAGGGYKCVRLETGE